MATVMTNTEFVKRCKNAAQNYKTLYVMGCFGAPMTASNKQRYTNNHSYNKQATRTKMINAATEDTFGFDCVCFIKGILWGWCGDKTRIYGGASYASNGVPDIGADTMITKCSDLSTDFNPDKMVPGEAVWMEGHIGVYIGDGLAVECTPKWDNKLQITACNCKKSGYNTRNWTKHGKLPYVSYVEEKKEPTPSPAPTADKKTVEELAKEVLDGKWGNGTDRKNRLTAAGYDYSAVQSCVNELCKKTSTTTTTVEEYKPKVGDVVTFTGNTHYTSSYASAKGKSCVGGQAKITAINLKGAHPYHLIKVSGKGSTVYGWVNEADIAELEKTVAEPEWSPKVGDIVEFTGNIHYASSNSTSPKSCKPGKAKITATYNGKHPYHLIRESGKGSTVYGWVDRADFKKA